MLKKIISLLFILFLYASLAMAQDASDKIDVVTTLFPTYDFARQVGKDKVNVSLLLPPGVESHAYDLKPQDIVRINKADVFIYTGKYMEPWVEDMLKGVSNKNLVVVDTSSGIKLLAESGHGEHTFEWAGSFDLDEGEYEWTFVKVGGNYADPTMKMVILQASASGEEGIEAVEETAENLMESNHRSVKKDGGILTVSPESAYQLIFDQSKDMTAFSVKIKKRGTYVFFTEHMPTEFEKGEHFFKDSRGKDIEPLAQEPVQEEHNNHSEESSHEQDHHHHHGGKDPHIWLDLGNAQIMVNTIAAALADKDPAHRDFYLKNAKVYKKKLADLDNRFKQSLSNCKHKTIMYGGHFAFGYFAKRYGLDHISPYKGFSPDAEPSPRAIAELISKLKESGQKYIFYEELLNPKVARVIAQEAGAKVELLHGAHNVSKDELKQGVNFLDIMEKNLKKLKVGLECE